MDPDRPKVSVVTPFLDAAPFLGDAIASVRDQRWPSWEHLLVDDGSTDGSGDIAEAAARSDERIRVLRHDGGVNRGRSASRNLALENARGDYVAFLDADDLFLPDKLARHVAILERHVRAGLTYGSTLLLHSPELAPHRRSPDFVTPLGAAAEQVHEPPALLRVLIEDEDAHPTNCSLLVRRELCEAVGGFDERFELYEDTVFLARVFTAAPAYVSGDCTAVYRLHPDSTCHRAEAAGEYDPFGPSAAELAYLEWLEEFLRDSAAGDEALRRAVERRLRPYRRPRLDRAARAASRTARLPRRALRAARRRRR